MSNDQAVLVLENGDVYRGQAYGARGQTLGEIVFNTGMTGYQETLTDPSYYQQIVVMTAPHIGNTGMNDQDAESRRIWVAGFVVREPARRSSNWRSQRTLEADLAEQGVVSLSGIDTRKLTRTLRTAGTMRAGIFSGDAIADDAELLARVRESAPMAGAHLADAVSIDGDYVISPPEGVDQVAHVVAVDLGIKAMTPELMAQRGIKVTVVPSSWTAEQILAREPDGVFFSNGPGDPSAADRSVSVVRGILDARVPLFGICFGNQLLGRALGYGTYKLRFGHRGINQPVMDRTTGKVEVTSHNHGFAVDAPLDGASDSPNGYGRVRVSHVCLNDDVVEGLECLDAPAFSVQYHPEAAAGPHDASYLFDRFLDLMNGRRTLEGTH
ncbi:glutamine-hydrolyzing carbamoyl-phosphate synthase small subunit [Demequina sp. TTPB684]|uniref:glutamine-hydrolyzing carbamoyl-phosphate synthase small subunit n=1 Tax=unclassified Demequina TaxID=2620311 RepID=UPI001CF1B6BE|nr:glutamine-hydrolyzing carbamoyl-phosphate synthase small subunit [Demequina sp. TMPB413]MCB2413090.1 glutamine-hydrolyzing carbamoyl-phosphate synthase small subunit [Demequina sp. TTPB684]UPU89254.1 glutamine-hydrolyzing carbamoyl-phosphate synthase small subunit [Demequina sp. TMPB413]